MVGTFKFIMPYPGRSLFPSRHPVYLAASARANVTAHPAAIMIIKARIICLILTSAKQRLIKRKYTPKTAVNKAKNAAITRTEHNSAAAGWT